MIVPTDDLIGLPWQLDGCGNPGYDCSGIAIEILRRLGANPPKFPGPNDYENNPTEVREKFGRAWIKLGETPLSATRVGDIVVTDPTSKGASLHLSIVVSDKPRRLLTAATPGGVIRAPQISESNTVGAYRLISLAGKVTP